MTRRPRPEPYRLPRDVDRATANAGASWPHVFADALRGGQPYRPLSLPAPPRRDVPLPLVVVAAVALYVAAALLL